MRKYFERITLIALLFAGLYVVAAEGKDNAAISDDLPQGGEQVTFVELGSVNCIPCKKMKPIVDAIEKEYAGKVRVVFHDVWRPEGSPYGYLYGIRLIPVQVFLDKNGKEIARHEGYFPKDDIEKLLADHGITK
ncbi:MAG: thioredoxin family protein [Candidatus Omnitrophica bacterium]|nr:thioredoxin family protein [Candidatus Omnitrophota bacterium]